MPQKYMTWHSLQKKGQLSEGSIKTAAFQVTVSGRAVDTATFSQSHRGLGNGTLGMLSPSTPFQMNMLKATAVSCCCTFMEDDTLTICLSFFCLLTVPRLLLLMTLTALSEIIGSRSNRFIHHIKYTPWSQDHPSWNPGCTLVNSVVCI